MKNPLSIFRKAYNKLFRRAPRGLEFKGKKLRTVKPVTSAEFEPFSEE